MSNVAKIKCLLDFENFVIKYLLSNCKETYCLMVSAENMK